MTATTNAEVVHEARNALAMHRALEAKALQAEDSGDDKMIDAALDLLAGAESRLLTAMVDLADRFDPNAAAMARTALANPEIFVTFTHTLVEKAETFIDGLAPAVTEGVAA